MVYDSNSVVSEIHQSPPSDQSRYLSYPYPPIPLPQHPRSTYAGPGGIRSLDSPRTSNQRLQSSVSSTESGSSRISTFQLHSSPNSYWQASIAEKGLVANDVAQAYPEWKSSIRTMSHHSPSRHGMAEDNSAVYQYMQDRRQSAHEEQQEDDHAIWILVWLSSLDCAHSLLSSLYTILIMIVLTIISPVRLCRNQTPFGDQVIRTLAPIHRHHLQMIYAPSVEDAHTFQYNATPLILVHLASPFLSIGVAIAAWVAGSFWLFAIIMGNPDGTEKRDDGKDTVLRVRDWWEKYLLNALKR